MHSRQLIDIAVAAKRWRSAQRLRLAAVSEKRLATEAVKALSTLFTLLTPERQREDAAAKALGAAKREERKALKVLAKLCDQAMPAEDVLTVDEVRALPRIEASEVA
ncbi:MAG: hypothetical protein QM740_17955 [Acidovorax sp.]